MLMMLNRKPAFLRLGWLYCLLEYAAIFFALSTLECSKHASLTFAHLASNSGASLVWYYCFNSETESASVWPDKISDI